MSGVYDIQVTVTDQAANCGDHAQDITAAVYVDPDETVRDIALRLLRRDHWVTKGELPPVVADSSKYLTIRLATPDVTP